MSELSVGEFRAGVRAWLDSNDLSPHPDGSSDLDGQVAQLLRVRAALYEAGWMRSGREQWCQGFSEPGSGSDLASLSTRAVARSDGSWVVTGQKVWTSLAQHAARRVLLTRTSPGHAGITAFFVDMSSPGITVRPLRTMHGVDEFAEVFFDEVVVPGDRMLGRPGDGWRVATDLLPYERSTCFWHRVAYPYARLDRLLGAACSASPTDGGAGGLAGGGADEAALGAAYVALHTLRCRSLATQRRLASGGTLGPETSVDKVLLAAAEQQLYDTARDLLPGVVELTASSWRTEYLYSRAATIYGGTAEIQRNIIARRLLDLGEGVTVVADAGTMDAAGLALLAETFLKTMSAASGQVLDLALDQLGWRDLLASLPEAAIPMAFRLLGETGAHAPILNDVMLRAAGRAPGDTVPLPYAGGSWVVWERSDRRSAALDDELPLRPVPVGAAGAGPSAPVLALAAGRRAVGWWLVGTGRAMLALARSHALDRVQFGRPLASFQAVRHRLAETLVALEGAEAALAALLAKAAAGQAALTAARHCQQVLGGIGFTAEHGLNRHVRRALVLDGLLGSARELSREAGARLVAERSAPRLVDP